MKRSIHDIRDNLDYVGCDDDTARELCDEVQRLLAGIDDLSIIVRANNYLRYQEGEWIVFEPGGECNDDMHAQTLVELVKKLGEQESH